MVMMVSINFARVTIFLDTVSTEQQQREPRMADNDASYAPEEDGKEADDEEDDLPPLSKSVWEDDMVERHEKGWKCCWCKEFKSSVNASKALCHVAKMHLLGVNVSLCRAAIPAKRLERYRAFLQNKQDKSSARKRAKVRVDYDITVNQEAASDELVKKKPRKYESNNPKALSIASSASSSKGGTRQQGLEAYASRESTLVYRSNEADLDMAIADMCHADGLPWNIGESARFQKVLHLARAIGPAYKPPNRNDVGGELLDLNWKTYCTASNKNLTDEADTFGLSFLGDMATIRRLPLVNIISSSITVPVAVLGVKDSSAHLAQGGKKDATYVSNLFLPHIERHDPQKSRTDLVFFDGASNVQKAGDILAAYFPRISVLHGTEHCIALFFSDISKLPEITVRCEMRFACFRFLHFMLHNNFIIWLYCLVSRLS